MCNQGSSAGLNELVDSLWQPLHAMKEIISSFQLTGDVRAQADEMASLLDKVQ